MEMKRERRGLIGSPRTSSQVKNYPSTLKYSRRKRQGRKRNFYSMLEMKVTQRERTQLFPGKSVVQSMSYQARDEPQTLQRDRSLWEQLPYQSKVSEPYCINCVLLQTVLPDKYLKAQRLGLPKKNRNRSNKQPNRTPTRTRGTTTKTTQSKYKEGNNQDQSRIK